MQRLKQWCVAGSDKSPRQTDGRRASVKEPSTWTSLPIALAAAEKIGGGVGFVLTESDPFTCIDLDVKNAASHPDELDKWTSQEDLDRHQSIIDVADSYTERSRSGHGFHIWVKGNIGKGRRKRGGVEVYSQERFIICTGAAHRAVPVADRQQMLASMISMMESDAAPVTDLRPDQPDDDLGACIAALALEDRGEQGRLMRGDWQNRNHPSQSEADFVLMKTLAQMTESNGACREAFRLSMLSKRKDKPGKYTDANLNRTLQKVRAIIAQDAAQLEVGQRIADAWFWKAPVQVSPSLGAAIPKIAASLAATDRRLVGRSLQGVQMRSIDWLWTGWIPKGYITLFAGETGAGKSTVLADITARVTTGAPWPGEYDEAPRQPGRVLWLGSEDSIEEMTIPRLTACGANLANVIEIEGVSHEGKRNTFSMQDDLEEVSRWLAFASEEGRPFAMLVIDPVTSYLPGQKLRKVDLNDAGHLRSILEPWLRLAQTHNIAIVCVTHFAKDTTRSMLHRVLGSAAFAQTCRSLCAVIQRPTPRDEEPEPHAKAFVQVKVNLPEHPGGAWKFSTEKVEVATDPRNGRVITATRPRWEGLDGGLTPESMMGGTRGPVSKYEATFGMWLGAQFIGHPPGHWLRIEVVKLAAINEKACTERWWSEHSGTFMEKQNMQGCWFCRPRQGKGETA